jgi:hypothetical protein
MSPIEETILALLADTAPGKSIDPMHVARVIQPERWQRALGQVRSTAIGMARQGTVVILRHNKPADPSTFKGVYRIRLPLSDDVVPGAAPADAPAESPADSQEA